MIEEKQNTESIAIISTNEEEIILDNKIFTQFVLHIEAAINEVFNSFDNKDYRIELLIALLSCASQISIDLNLVDDDLIYLLLQSYNSTKKQIKKEKEESIKTNININ